MSNIFLYREVGNGNYLDCYDEIQDSLEDHFGGNLVVTRTKKTTIKKLLLKYLPVHLFYKIFSSKSKKVSIFLLMGGDFEILLPYNLYSNRNVIYMFDAWPRNLIEIKNKAEELGVKQIFFSSQKITQYFNKFDTKISALWVPEGIKISDYKYELYQNKNIDVLEFGRKYLKFNNSVTSILIENGYTHIYEKIPGELIFNSRKDFITGLSKAKISVCFPSNLTHPERAEDISSMTLRYLQSMASKCLIVGTLPDEMKLLFNYCPIVEIDFERPGEQLVQILDDFDSYIPLIEKNYKEVSENHTWGKRISKIIKDGELRQ